MEIQAIGSVGSIGGSKSVSGGNKDLFDRLWNIVGDMNQNQQQANGKMDDVLTGKSDDSQGALIGLEKADLQLQLAVTVRDKVIQGYQQLINMQM
jgi:flagellar hook-basal body complex protein FliE